MKKYSFDISFKIFFNCIDFEEKMLAMAKEEKYFLSQSEEKKALFVFDLANQMVLSKKRLFEIAGSIKD